MNGAARVNLTWKETVNILKGYNTKHGFWRIYNMFEDRAKGMLYIFSDIGAVSLLILTFISCSPLKQLFLRI